MLTNSFRRKRKNKAHHIQCGRRIDTYFMFWLRSKQTLTQMTCAFPPFFPLVNVCREKKRQQFFKMPRSNASIAILNGLWAEKCRIICVSCAHSWVSIPFITFAWVRTTLMALKINQVMHSKFYRTESACLYLIERLHHGTVNGLKTNFKVIPKRSNEWYRNFHQRALNNCRDCLQTIMPKSKYQLFLFLLYITSAAGWIATITWTAYAGNVCMPNNNDKIRKAK